MIPRPSIAESARLRIFSDVSVTSGQYECSWSATWDAAAQQVTDVELLGRGSRTHAPMFACDLAPGSLALHSHPNGLVEPSEGDIRCAMELAPLGIGFGITDNIGSLLYLVRPPRAPWLLQEARRRSANGLPPRVFRLGSFELVLYRHPRHP